MSQSQLTQRTRDAVAGAGRRAKRIRKPRKLLVVGAIVLALVVALALAVWLAITWTDLRWYQVNGHENVFWVRIWSATLVWLGFTIVGFAILHTAARAAWRCVGESVRAPRATALVCLALAGWLSAGQAKNWQVFRLAADQSPFGTADPQTGRDIGFFVFTLPALENLLTWLVNILALATVLLITILLLSSRLDEGGAVRVSGRRAQAAAAVLTSGLLLALAGNSVITIWQASYSTVGSPLAGAGYTDVHARIPGLVILALLALAVALMLLVTARRLRWKLVLGGFAALVLASYGFGQVIPGLVQRYIATPNEATREAPYIQRNIDLTRDAYGLADVAARAYPGLSAVPKAAAATARAQLAEAPIWTPDTVAQAFNQLQTIRPYYQLSAINYDRYSFGGQKHQVLVAAREIATTGLPGGAQTWVNQHLVYTHGFGLAMSSASQTSGQGFPSFLIGDVPPRVALPAGQRAGASALDITQPRIYFGPDQSGYILVNTGIDEFDYPSGVDNVTCRCADANTGVQVGGPLSRAAWALRFGSPDLLLSDYVRSDSRIIVGRNITTLARKLAPWLVYDAAYPAIVDGRIVWIMEGYTSSNHFPYSQPTGGVNYQRDSVRVVVDAFTGQIHFYANGADPVRDAWARIYPGVISSADQTPTALQTHLRPPMKQFSTQASVFAQYHMTEAPVFYNQEDLWRRPTDSNGNVIAAAYVMWQPPGEKEAGLYLLQPFSLPNRDNLVGWMAMSTEPNTSVERTVYRLGKDRVTLGAAQVSARINQDPTISQQLTLWNQPGSQLVFGNMLVLPVAESVAYVQPVFLRASQSGAITELVGVIAVNGSRVELGKGLTEALAKAYPGGK